MCYYLLKINDKIVRDRLIQTPQEDIHFKHIHQGNLIGNILKIYCELDPIKCFNEWGAPGKNVIQKARQNGNILTIDDKPYIFAIEPNMSTTRERCYSFDDSLSFSLANKTEPFWILARSVEPDYWLVMNTRRDDQFLGELQEMCERNFLKPYGIKSITFRKV